jgi:hypothetical protein
MASLQVCESKEVNEGQMAHPEFLHIFQKYVAGVQRRATEGKERSFQSLIEVAEAILKVAETKNPRLRIRASDWAGNFCKIKTETDPDGTKLLSFVKEIFLN